MKSIVKIYVKGDNDEPPIAVIEIPAIGNATIVLDRNDAGGIFVDKAEVEPNKEFSIKLYEMESCLGRVHHQLAITKAAMDTANVKLFEVHHALKE